MPMTVNVRVGAALAVRASAGTRDESPAERLEAHDLPPAVASRPHCHMRVLYKPHVSNRFQLTVLLRQSERGSRKPEIVRTVATW